MSTLSNTERFIGQYAGTAIGESVKNMLENGTDLEYICEFADIEFDSEEDD